MLKLIAIISLSILIASAQTKPSITHFSPTTGVIGSTVIITGQNFSKTAQNNKVRFGGVKATV
ncbi:MAG: IPT/TIG domain-containing protein, partial [Bacteroidetes bacterium]|nr:IPT/TIG domain-containing protein [Bacteroidota bacterium]